VVSCEENNAAEPLKRVKDFSKTIFVMFHHHDSKLPNCLFCATNHN
jgi:hypothetical protein